MTSATLISNDMMNYITLLLNVINARDWTTFEGVALSNPQAFRLISKRISNYPAFYGTTLLHASVSRDPPLRVVRQMIDFCPDLTSELDCLDRTPLHIAAGTGASPSLIKLLAKACPASCVAQDEDGKTPLHLACDSSCDMFENEKDDREELPRGPPSSGTICALLSASLKAATMEDDDGMSALEYAIISDASIQVVMILQKAVHSQIKKQGAQPGSGEIKLPTKITSSA